MATHPQSTVSERPEFSVVEGGGRRAKARRSSSMKARLISTAIALLVLALMFRFLPTEKRNARASEPAATTWHGNPEGVHLTSVQMSQTVGGEALYLDGRVTNDGSGRITEATAEVAFLDAHGEQVAVLQKPLAGLSQGGIGVVSDEFSNNPLGPREMRFFRIAIRPDIDNVPATWNHEVPELKIVAVKVK